MINKLLSLIINIVLTVITSILNLVLAPLTTVVEALFPGVSSHIAYFNTLLNEHLFDGLKFAREVLFNITGINRNLVGIAVMIPLTYLFFTIANAGVRFIVSVYRIYKTGKDE